MFRVRLLLMGLLSALAIGMVAAATAPAEAGPFWHQRRAGEKGSGTKIEQSKSVKYSGQGKVRFFYFAIKIPEELEGEIQMEGDIWNGPNQGQLKAQVKFGQIMPPGQPACISETKVPENYLGHLMWKWNGEAEQLKEPSQAKQQKWDVMLTPGQTKLGEKGLSGKNPLATVSFGASCGGFSNSTLSFKGAMVFSADATLEAFHSAFTLIGSLPRTLVTPFDMHYWNGKESIGLEENLFAEMDRSSLEGRVPVEFGQGKEGSPEIAVFEK